MIITLTRPVKIMGLLKNGGLVLPLCRASFWVVVGCDGALSVPLTICKRTCNCMLDVYSNMTVRNVAIVGVPLAATGSAL